MPQSLAQQDQERPKRDWGCFTGFVLSGLLLLALPFLALSTCAPSRDEVARVASPAGGADAVLIEINGGATTDFAYSVRLEEPGWLGSTTEVASLYAAHRSPCAYGVNLRWAGPDRLLIEYHNARRSEAHPAEAGGRTVQVELKPGTVDPRAPCGGMEYNLRGRPNG